MLRTVSLSSSALARVEDVRRPLELYQAFCQIFRNAWLANASHVNVNVQTGRNNYVKVVISDNGVGLRDPGVLLRAGVSGWGWQAPVPSIPHEGLGFFRMALCQKIKGIRVSSFNWSLAFVPGDICDGAEFRIDTDLGEVSGMTILLEITDIRPSFVLMDNLRKARGLYPYSAELIVNNSVEELLPYSAGVSSGVPSVVISTQLGTLTVGSIHTPNTFSSVRDYCYMECVSEFSEEFFQYLDSRLHSDDNPFGNLDVVWRPSSPPEEDPDPEVAYTLANAVADYFFENARTIVQATVALLETRRPSVINDELMAAAFQEDRARFDEAPPLLRSGLRETTLLRMFEYSPISVGNYRKPLSTWLNDDGDDDGDGEERNSYVLDLSDPSVLWVANELIESASLESFRLVAESGLFGLHHEDIARAILDHYELDVEAGYSEPGQSVHFVPNILWGNISLPYLVIHNNAIPSQALRVLVRGEPRQLIATVLGKPEQAASIINAALIVDSRHNGEGRWVDENGTVLLREFCIYLAKDLARRARDEELQESLGKIEQLFSFSRAVDTARNSLKRPGSANELMECPFPEAQRDLDFAWIHLERVAYAANVFRSSLILPGEPLRDYENATVISSSEIDVSRC